MGKGNEYKSYKASNGLSYVVIAKPEVLDIEDDVINIDVSRPYRGGWIVKASCEMTSGERRHFAALVGHDREINERSPFTDNPTDAVERYDALVAALA